MWKIPVTECTTSSVWHVDPEINEVKGKYMALAFHTAHKLMWKVTRNCYCVVRKHIMDPYLPGENNMHFVLTFGCLSMLVRSYLLNDIFPLHLLHPQNMLFWPGKHQ